MKCNKHLNYDGKKMPTHCLTCQECWRVYHEMHLEEIEEREGDIITKT